MTKKTIQKKIILTYVAEKAGISFLDANKLYDRMIYHIWECVKKREKFMFNNFGSFNFFYKRKMIGRNPKKKDDLYIIKAKYGVRFKPSINLKKRVNGMEKND